jgi:hypothetical protein
MKKLSEREVKMNKKTTLLLFILLLLVVSVLVLSAYNALGEQLNGVSQVQNITLTETGCSACNVPSPHDILTEITQGDTLEITEVPAEWRSPTVGFSTQLDTNPYEVAVTDTSEVSPPTPVTPTFTFEPSLTILPKPFGVQSEPVSFGNVIYPEEGCGWMGVVGQVFDKNGEPQKGITVMIFGTIDGQEVDLLGLTGVAGGYHVPYAYEVKIADHSFTSSGFWSIILYDTKGNAISEPFLFSTYDGCENNVIIINFMENSHS